MKKIETKKKDGKISWVGGKTGFIYCVPQKIKIAAFVLFYSFDIGMKPLSVSTRISI
jgi:hypothetical protein